MLFPMLAALALPTIPVPPQPLLILLPLLTTVLTGWVSHARLPRANSLIALIVILVVATIWALLSNQLAGSLTVDIIVIAGYCAAMMAGPLSGLQRWLTVRLASPFDLVLGPSSSPPVSPRRRSVPPRASRFPRSDGRATWPASEDQETRPHPVLSAMQED